jgi:hypothetical protein
LLRDLAFLLLLCCASQFVWAQEESLKVEVHPTGNTVKNAAQFSISTVLRNTGSIAVRNTKRERPSIFSRALPFMQH